MSTRIVLITRYSNPTNARISIGLNVDAINRFASPVISGTVMTLANEVAFSNAIAFVKYGGTAIRTAWGRKSLEVYGEVLRLAGDCAAAGAHGVVCSGLEAQKISAKYGEKLKLLVPGIRPAGGRTRCRR